MRTGEFFIFKAKAVILATAQPLRIWVFNTELAGSNVAHDDPNLAGDGNAMGWLAGAELTLMERSMPLKAFMLQGIKRLAAEVITLPPQPGDTQGGRQPRMQETWANLPSRENR
jgi:succinate dehydrogenase/fumarate reductase flavoprotein subunit